MTKAIISKIHVFLPAVLICAVSASPLAAQAPVFDTSGNHLLSGTYYFRQVLYGISGSADTQGIYGDISEAIAAYGNITFDGNGNYYISGGTGGGLVSDSSVGAPVPLSCYLAGTTCTSGAQVAGTYSISASGYGFISDAITGDPIYGLVSATGIFSGSSTETGSSYADMFLAAPLATPTPTNATFQGTYTVTGFLPGGSPTSSADVFFQMTPDGNGNLGTVTVNGYYGGGGATTISQSNSGLKYSFSSGAAIVTWPTSSTANFFSGPEYFYFSPDGNFFFGGSPTNGYDMIMGVRNTSATQSLTGLYYEAGVDQDLSQVTSSGGQVDFDGYYGSFNATSAGYILAADRINDPFYQQYVNTYADTFPLPLTATYTDTASSFQYALGAGGAIRIGEGIWPYLGITVAFQAPTFTPTGSVYLNPTGVVNAASFSPFTAGVSNGEFITIYGNNLASSTVVASTVPYPTILGGVQVIINGVAAPLYFVTPGQIAAIVPSQNPYSYAQIQVINNNVASNAVTLPVYMTTPGVYTIPSGGIGYAAAVHTSGQIVSPSNPAAPGETIELFTTGLGTAYPPVADGAAPPLSPLSPTVNTIDADVGGTTATVLFAGLAPTLAGLYQVNVTMPSTLTAGDYTMDISGPDSYAAQALVSIGTTGTGLAARQPAAKAVHSHAKTKPMAKRPALCGFNKSSCPAQK